MAFRFATLPRPRTHAPGPYRGPMTLDRPRRVRCVGAIISDAAGRLLLIQRGHEPAAGLWSIPGGRVEPGESDEAAVIREIAEETGLTVTVGALAGMVERPGAPGTIYEIYDYDAIVAINSDIYDATAVGPGPGPSPGGRAADDAADLRWVHPSDLGTLPLTPGLVEALESWGRLPATEA